MFAKLPHFLENSAGGGLPDSYGSACEIVQRHNPGDLFLACEDRQPAHASLSHELFSLFDVLVLKARCQFARANGWWEWLF